MKTQHKIANQFIEAVNALNLNLEVKKLRGYDCTAVVSVKGQNLDNTFYFDSWKEYTFETELGYINLNVKK